ncbi:hypothetical protein EDC01DRAFT_764783 [Geopyxis carbonaria]|nr:hypothetical protein EDC01DRAFT_764783 [Geopyxis carbonaria]
MQTGESSPDPGSTPDPPLQEYRTFELATQSRRLPSAATSNEIPRWVRLRPGRDAALCAPRRRTQQTEPAPPSMSRAKKKKDHSAAEDCGGDHRRGPAKDTAPTSPKYSPQTPPLTLGPARQARGNRYYHPHRLPASGGGAGNDRGRGWKEVDAALTRCVSVCKPTENVPPPALDRPHPEGSKEQRTGRGGPKWPSTQQPQRPLEDIYICLPPLPPPLKEIEMTADVQAAGYEEEWRYAAAEVDQGRWG